MSDNKFDKYLEDEDNQTKVVGDLVLTLATKLKHVIDIVSLHNEQILLMGDTISQLIKTNKEETKDE